MADDSYDYVTPTGVIVPDTAQILADVTADFQAAFGQDLILTPDTPQGVLATAETLARTSVAQDNATVANQINPNYAGGIFLDDIGGMTGIQRLAATKTVVSGVNLTGIAGTTVSEGTQCKTGAGDLFATQSTVVLDLTGAATVDFASVAFGPIPCAVHALDTLVTSIVGLETVDNTNAGVIGTATQTDQSFRAYRNNTLGFQGVALPIAITSALYATTGVTSLQFLENYESDPMGMLISVTGGTTLSDTMWGLTTTGGSGDDGTIIVGTDDMNFAESLQDLPTLNPWPIAAFTTTGNITLSGLTTQGGGDWPSTLTAGNIILVKNQTTESQNGVWLAASGSWTRQAYNVAASQIFGSNMGISLKKNSVYACVQGGADMDVAAALLENKSSGAGWNGNNLVNVIEPASGQIYSVRFDRPAQISILVRVTTPNGNANNVKQAVVDYANGLIAGMSGFIVGADVLPFEISGAILARYPSYFITKVEVSVTTSVSYSTNNIPIAVNEIAYTQLSYVNVVTG